MRIGTKIIIIQIAIATAVGTASAAQVDPKAKASYEEGKAFFEAGEFEKAMTAFTEAYNLSAEPTLLFNLAATAERLGDRERARAYYQVYLEELPDAEDAAEVRTRIEELSGAPAAETTEPPQDNVSETPVPAPSTAATSDLDSEDLRTYYQSRKDKKARRIVWPAAVMGAGGLLVAGGIIAAILAKTKYDDLSDTCSPNCTDGKVSSAKAPAVAADVMFITGGIAVTAGVVGLVLSKKKQRESKHALQVFSGPLPDGALIGAKGNF